MVPSLAEEMKTRLVAGSYSALRGWVIVLTGYWRSRLRSSASYTATEAVRVLVTQTVSLTSSTPMP